MARSKHFAARSAALPDVDRSLLALLWAVDYGVLFTDLDHMSLICNARFGELFGIEPEQVVRNNVQAVRNMVRRRISRYDEWEVNLAKVYERLDYEQEDELELANPHAILRRYTGPVRDEKGEVVGRLWTFLDVTRQVRKRQMQEALHAATLFFDPDPGRVCQFVADQVGHFYGSVAIISILDKDFMRFHTVGGPPSQARDLPGNPLQDTFCQFCLQRMEPLIIQDARREPSTAQLLPVQVGLTRYAGVPIYDPLGGAIGTLCILDGRSEEALDSDDITFLTQSSMKIAGELERERQLGNLRSNLDRTTIELREAQSKLIQSEKLAIAGTLAASIAHDIRNILSSLSLQVDMGASDPEKALDYVKSSLTRFNILAHRLLSYARPKRIEFEHVDLTQVVERVALLLGPHFAVTKAELEVATGGGPAYVMGDEGRLEHLIVNLVVNALQALKPGGKIRVGVERTNGNIALSVADNGPGIPLDLRARLFEPFSSTRADGFGLGLYSCKQIVDEHGGTIDFDSEKGQGTTFRIRLREAK